MSWCEKLLGRVNGPVVVLDPCTPVWGFVISSMLLTALYRAGVYEQRAAGIALGGALGACWGVISLARPLFRAGGYLAWLEKENTVDGGNSPPTPEEVKEGQEQRKDALAVQIVGPALIIVGTLANGASGFF